jgi:hypothetical protein
MPRDRQLAALLLLPAERLAHHLARLIIWPPMPGISNGICGACSTSISTSVMSRWPSWKRWLEGLAGRLARFLAGQRVEQAAIAASSALSFTAERRRSFSSRIGFLDQIAGDLLDVAADIADLGELGRLDLHEGRVGQLGEAAADLGLAAAGGPDHQDVLGRHLVAEIGGRAAGGASGCAARRRRPSWRRSGR